MKVLFCSSEVAPFSKTGGLGDVSGSLPLALKEAGVRIKVVTPSYSSAQKSGIKTETINDYAVRGRFGPNNTEIFFIRNQDYFKRKGLYQEQGKDYPDNLERFTYFCRQTLQLIKDIDFQPDVIHCNDWQTALIPVYLKTLLRREYFYRKIKTVFTIHNLGYQGVFGRDQFPLTGLDWDLFALDWLEYYGKVNLLKGGLLFSDRLTTVSPTYAREIQTELLGCGLQGVLRKRRNDLKGIINGIDNREWDPQHISGLARNYRQQRPAGKQENKLELQKQCGFVPDRKIPLIGFVGRLADQKGLDLLAPILGALNQLPLQLVILGTGEPRHHRLLRAVSRKYDNIRAFLKFDSGLAARIYAGSDIFIMPSRYEPCGLGQMISFRFGSVPLVRNTGGLADTVIDFDPMRKTGTGLVFDHYEPGALLEAIKRGICLYADRKQWEVLVSRIMKLNFSWEKPARDYRQLYRDVTR